MYVHLTNSVFGFKDSTRKQDWLASQHKRCDGGAKSGWKRILKIL